MLKRDDILNFGKYKGCAVGDVLGDDPHYLKWMMDENIVELDGKIALEVDLIARHDEIYGHQFDSHCDNYGDR